MDEARQPNESRKKNLVTAKERSESPSLMAVDRFSKRNTPRIAGVVVTVTGQLLVVLQPVRNCRATSGVRAEDHGN